ncbi:MAG TPA: extracellular solute-binding protein [Clostridiales bacterium]|nr:extracellular solute-binding protein [Clostridiales bacterium]
MTGNPKKVVALVLSLCIILSLGFTGCVKKTVSEGSKEPSAQTTANNANTQAKPEEPYEFSIFRSTWTELNEDTDLVIQELNKKFNIKIKILTCPYEAWVEKYNIYVTSGDVPDLSVTTGPGTMNFNAWAKQGIYLELTDLYSKHCPNIQKHISNDIIEAHRINGGLYGIPKPSLSDTTAAIRADWLEKLNLSMPKTLDDLYSVLKAFMENDPDGNNKNDTYGLCSEDTLNTIDFIFGAFGCHCPPNIATNWVPDGNGKLTSNLLEPGMKDAIKYVTKLYRDKILDQEWMLTKSQAYVDKIHTGKVGVTKVAFQTMIAETETKIKANDPACKLEILEGVTGPEGKYARPMQKGFYMVSSISNKAKNPVKILQFLDYLMSTEGDKLIRYGVEGITYTEKDGKIVRNEEAVKKYGMESGHKFRQILQSIDIVIPGEDPRIPQLKEMAKVLYEGPFYPAPTLQPASLKEVTTKQGPDFVKNSVAAIVTGNGDVDKEWDEFIKKWRESGGDQLIKEINELYEANK